MQLPMFTMLANSTFDDLIMKALFIQVYDDGDVEDFIAKFVAELDAKTYGHLDIYSRYTDEQPESNPDLIIHKTINISFFIQAAVTMIYGLLSLIFIMVINLYRYRKEFGVLRVIGFTKVRLRFLFF